MPISTIALVIILIQAAVPVKGLGQEKNTSQLVADSALPRNAFTGVDNDLNPDEVLQSLPSQPLHYQADTFPAANIRRPEVALPILEQQMQAAPEVLVAATELEESLSRLDHAQARSGLELRGDAGGGYFQELETSDRTRNYNEIHIGARLRYPLLGKYEKQKINIMQAEARTWENQQKLRLAERISLKLLRSHYINYWGSQKKIELSRTFLEKEPEIERILHYRARTGYILAADRQEFLTTFALVRRNIAKMTAVNQRSLRIIRLLTRPDLKPFAAALPVLPACCSDMDKLRSEIFDNYPELKLHQGLVEEKLGVLELTRIGDIDAHVDFGGFVSQEDTADRNEYGVILNFNVRLPAEIRRANNANRKAALAALKGAQHQLDFRSDSVLADAEDALHRYRADAENLNFAIQRLKASLERVRENLLRSNQLSGDMLEKLEQSRYQYCLAAIDLIDA